MKGYVQCQAPVLPVRSVAESIVYYRDVLGFEVAWIYDEDGYAAVRCGDIEFHLDKQETYATYRVHSYLFVDDIEAIYDYYRQQGVEIVDALASKPWGVKEFTFQDINGHRFRIAYSEEE